MNEKKYKILLGKPGLDGHDVGVKVLAHALLDSGFEVIYSGLRKSIKEIVEMAIEKEVDSIGLSILSGTHLVLSKEMAQEMKKNNLTLPWVVGGNIPDEDVEIVKQFGATAAFPTGTTMKEVVDYFNELK